MVDHLRMAYNYLDDFHHTNETDRSKLNEILGFAAGHLVQTRNNAPNATITITENKEEKTLTIDQVSALALFYEAKFAYGVNDTKRALTSINKSINYRKNAPFYRLLAQIEIKRYNRQPAQLALDEALKIDPDDMETYKIVDKMRANRDLGVKAPIYTNTVFLGFTGLGLIIFGIYLLVNTGPIGILVILAGGACFIFQRWFGNREIEDEVRGWKRRQL